jgi:hypothetical protein
MIFSASGRDVHCILTATHISNYLTIEELWSEEMALDKENAVSASATDLREKRTVSADASLTSPETTGEAVDMAAEFAERSATQISKMLDYSFRMTQEATKHTTQNLDIMMQCGTIVAEGWQKILREWISATQENAQKNMTDLQELMQCRSVDTLFARQSNILRDRIEAVQNSNARISEVSTQVANETAKRISEMSGNINFGATLVDDAQKNLRKAGAEMARVDRAGD